MVLKIIMLNELTKIQNTVCFLSYVESVFKKDICTKAMLEAKEGKG